MPALLRSQLGLLLLLAIPGHGTDPENAIAAAPQWDCSPHSKDPSRVIWKSGVGGTMAGALSVGDGRILVGASDTGSAGIMTALDTSGRLLWRARHPSLNSRLHDYGQSIKSQACFDGDRAYYMSNRGELVCVDLAGFRDNDNAGPFKDEPSHGVEDADFVWKIDLTAELGVFKRDHSDVGNPLPSPVVLGDLVFCVTAHGVPSQGRADPKPPSFLAVHKLTGQVAWSSNAPGANIAYSQWSSLAIARIAGADQVIFPGGDGVLYGFEPATGRQLWKLDCNRPGALDRHAGGFKWQQIAEARCGFVARLVVDGEMLYASLNESIESPRPLPLLAIHLAEPDGQPKIAWQFAGPDFHGTLAAPAVDHGLVFVTDVKCTFFALDAQTGGELWRAQLDADAIPCFAGPAVDRGRVYTGGETSVTVFASAREKKCLGRYELNEVFLSTPQFAEDRMFIAAGPFVYALRLPE